MRVLNGNLSAGEQQRASDFAKWLLQVREGQAGNSNDYIELLDDMLLPLGKENLPALLQSIYDSIGQFRSEADLCAYFTSRAILAPLNRDVDMLNNVVLNMFPGNVHVLPSADDAVDPTGSSTATEGALYPTEFLNTITPTGIALHHLRLKVGCPMMLLRNLDPGAGLWNGTRMIISRISRRVLEAIIITGPHA